MTTIQERIEAGAKWLDANRPGWVDRINLETLDLGSCVNCVIGQLDGNFADSDISIRGTEAGSLGFARYDGGAFVRRYAELTAAWRDYITARRAAA